MSDIPVAFLSGFFYTSFFTAPLSILLLVYPSFSLNPYLIAAIAGAGAVLGDLIIVKVLRTAFGVFSLVNHQNSFKSLKKWFKSCHLDLVAILLGSAIVASPLPDELGLILLGVSKLSYFKLAVLTFFLNAAGILVILLTLQNFR